MDLTKVTVLAAPIIPPLLFATLGPTVPVPPISSTLPLSKPSWFSKHFLSCPHPRDVFSCTSCPFLTALHLDTFPPRKRVPATRTFLTQWLLFNSFWLYLSSISWKNFSSMCFLVFTNLLITFWIWIWVLGFSITVLLPMVLLELVGSSRTWTLLYLEKAVNFHQSPLLSLFCCVLLPSPMPVGKFSVSQVELRLVLLSHCIASPPTHPSISRL